MNYKLLFLSALISCSLSAMDTTSTSTSSSDDSSSSSSSSSSWDNYDSPTGFAGWQKESHDESTVDSFWDRF